ncbi:ankyrin repeats (3 copies) domain-containing protein [Trichoderma breve]|uniref:Ankyrin repeats (3 copies) domain-containing protein n=1 Tax=Trichoderma breve TaxID=2034170 RepID=A0A9W9B2T3_9HYPO|nr:ankyrin repeats (3 copies) domain-containing protein [Trichoderma breve]KAJ4854237.1 ankyrin repeats (3 copies) domain-containing protein [Trichoderma breve]
MVGRLSSYFKRKNKKRDGTKSSSGPVSDAEASPARSAISLRIPPTTSRETETTINDKSEESQPAVMSESVKPNNVSDLWSQAYQELDDKAKKWIGDASKNVSGEERTQDLITLVQNREEEYKDGTLKIRIGDFEIMWRDYANSVVSWITAIGDISISFAPAGASVAWSALKVLLKANVSQCEDLAAIFGCAEKVLRLMRHGRVYEDVYLSGGSCNGATENLKDALVDLYKGLMELLTHAFVRLNEGQGKQFLRALVSGGEGAKLISALTEQEQHQTLLKSLDEPLKNVENTVKKLLQKVEDGTVEQALEYISTIPIGEHQQEKREARTPRTCEWLLNHSRFIEWERSSYSSMLWLQGNVGAGKSFLTSKVIDYLPVTRQQEAEYDEGFAYFYCSRSDPERRQTKYILRSYGEGTVKVFIASRKEADIEEYLGLKKLVEISTDNKEDIEKYVEEEVAKVSGIWRSVSAEVKEQVKKTIGEKSDGMFRWAYLQWQELKKMRTNQSIRERLGKLPKSLTETYEEIYSRNEEKVILQRAVKWVLCSRRPLTSEELLMAIRLESNLESVTVSDPIDESTLESICSHLVVLDSQLKVWKFPHASVAEYFESEHKSWIDTAPEDVAILLVSCLIDCYSNWTLPESNREIKKFLKTAPDLDDYLDPRHPLQKYTGNYWLEHVKITADQCQEVARISEILKRFLGSKGPQQSSSQYQAWYRHMDIIDKGDFDFDVDDLHPSEKSIFFICVFDFHKLFTGWWDKDIDVSQVNGMRLDLLAIAASYGHDELCSELISRGSDIHRELDSNYGSALMEAIVSSRIGAAMLLLEKGANPNFIRKDGSCALESATYSNRIDSAKLLIKYGANVNLADEKRKCGSPLGAAAYEGSLEYAKFLVENGADVNAHLPGKYGSVLAAGIFGSGGIQMVKYLIEEAGADPGILSFSLPQRSPWISHYWRTERTERQETAKYLIEGGHVQESVLLDIGFPKEDMPEMEE